MEIKTSDIADAFDEFVSGYDLYGDKWQDMGLDEVFAAGYKAALSKLEPVAEVKHWNVGGSGEFVTAEGINKLPDGTKLYAVPNELEG